MPATRHRSPGSTLRQAMLYIWTTLWCWGTILGAFAKLRKSNTSCVMTVRPSVRLSVYMKQLGSLWTDFYGI
jgi:hypothetical protein